MGIDAVMRVWIPGDVDVELESRALSRADLGGLWRREDGECPPALGPAAPCTYELFPAPPAGGTVLDVGFSTRYYGPGYERGDVSAICGTAEWLRHRFPGCIVYYGGDSGDTLSPINTEVLWAHAASKNGRAYRGVVL